MKYNKIFSRQYEGIDNWEPGACAGPRYSPARDDYIVNSLGALCIPNGDYTFLWYSEGSLLKIDVDLVRHRDEQQYQRVVKIQTMPVDTLPTELSDLLAIMGFEEEKRKP